MSWDLSALLEQWPFEPGRVNVRLVPGDDGEPRIQVRLDLGVLQMRLDGRPDGVQPAGLDSLLDYFEAKAEHEERGAPPPPPLEVPGVKLDPSGEPAAPEAEEEPEEAEPPRLRLGATECRWLRDEAVQFYHRYVALLVLEDYERVIRDTTRNLRVLDLCADRAAQESDRQMLEQFRPSIVMMRTRALASLALQEDEARAALHAVDLGLDALREIFAERGEPELYEMAAEAQALRNMREQLVPRLPVSQRAELRQRLQDAIRRENYELAAILRDELRQLEG